MTLRRAVTTAAACAGSEREFFTRLELAGRLARKRFSRHNPGQVTGYAVALPGDTSRAGEPVWFGGGRLALDLTWPKLRHRWAPASAAGERFTPAERAAIWEHAAGAAGTAAAEIRALASTNPASRRRRRMGRLQHAARRRCRAAQRRPAPSRRRLRPGRTRLLRPPRPTPAGGRLRHAAWLLGTLAQATRDPGAGQLMLLTRLAALADAVAQLRDAQHHAAQAAAARTAAEQLHTAAHGGRATPRPARRSRTLGQLAAADFPFPIRPGQPPPGWAALARTGHTRHAIPPRRHPSRAARAADSGYGTRWLHVPVTDKALSPGWRWDERVNLPLAPRGLPRGLMRPGAPARQGHSSSLALRALCPDWRLAADDWAAAGAGRTPPLSSRLRRQGHGEDEASVNGWVRVEGERTGSSSGRDLRAQLPVAMVACPRPRVR